MDKQSAKRVLILTSDRALEYPPLPAFKVRRFIQTKVHFKFSLSSYFFSILHFLSSPFIKNHINSMVTCRVISTFFLKKIHHVLSSAFPKWIWTKTMVGQIVCDAVFTLYTCHLGQVLQHPHMYHIPSVQFGCGGGEQRDSFLPDWRRTDAACGGDDVSGRAVVYFWVAGCCVVGVPGCGCC